MELGLRRGTVAVEPHNAEWETAAQQTIAQLRSILGSIVMDAQHIGSTSIKGICAKPIIDIVVGAADFNDILGMNDVLEKNGFIFRGQDVPEQYLYVCGDADTRTHHIHAVIYGSEVWNNYINMRDYLNCHRDDAQAYSQLKEKLAEQYPDDRNKYTEMKSAFISDILAKARQWRNSISKGI
ncbi:GrpB family protein [Ruminococcus flavefaciens]|uniref:GrpB family protein n=1 Tax=Ruminococcus flavefaciens TaxID=1265 RepID=UPI00046390A1|nr:GrpB family protein [Ruminococcus flavefaciens]